MVARPGFDRLVAWLCAGEVGAVFCFDELRLARNGRDWHHLLELCGLVAVNGTLKVECVNDVHFETPEQARQEIVEFIGCYNTERRHSSLGNIAPAEFERRWRAGSNPTPTELPQ